MVYSDEVAYDVIRLYVVGSAANLRGKMMERTAVL